MVVRYATRVYEEGTNEVTTGDQYGRDTWVEWIDGSMVNLTVFVVDES